MEGELTVVKMGEMEALNPGAAVAEEPNFGKGKLAFNYNSKWTDELIRKLIVLWSERPALYDTKHEAYYSKNKRREAMIEICDNLDMSFHEIQLKMVSLRTYYGSQQRKKIAWENDPTKTTPFKSRWQFWLPLQFLQDHMTQKQVDSKTTLSLEDECFSPELLEETERDPTDVSKIQMVRNKPVKRKTEKGAKVEETFPGNSNFNEDTLEKRQKIGKKDDFEAKSDDELFAEVLLKSLAKIEEGEAKEALKLEIQNLVFRARFGSQRLVLGNGSMQIPGGYPSPYAHCNNVVFRGNCDSGIHSNHGSDEEPSMASRRKSTNPKRSAQNELNKMRDYEIVTVSQEYSGTEAGQLKNL